MSSATCVPVESASVCVVCMYEIVCWSLFRRLCSFLVVSRRVEIERRGFAISRHPSCTVNTSGGATTLVANWQTSGGRLIAIDAEFLQIINCPDSQEEGLAATLSDRFDRLSIFQFCFFLLLFVQMCFILFFYFSSSFLLSAQPRVRAICGLSVAAFSLAVQLSSSRLAVFVSLSFYQPRQRNLVRVRSQPLISRVCVPKTLSLKKIAIPNESYKKNKSKKIPQK